MKSELRRALFFLALASPAFVFVVCPYPPWQDWPAHAGVIGGLIHLNEPSARLLELYDYGGWLKLNGFFYLPPVLFAKVMSPLSAANLMFALSVAALPLSMVSLCRAVGSDSRLALLAVPLALGRHVYCGFAPNALALAFMVWAFAAHYRMRARPHALTFIALAIWLALLAFTHAFIHLATAGLLLLAAAVDSLRAPRRAPAATFAAVALSGLVFAFLFAQGLGVRGASGDGAFAAIVSAVRNDPRTQLPEEFWSWLFASYRHERLDDVFQMGWTLFLGVALILGLFAERGRLARSPRLQLIALAAVAVFMFWLLPSNVGPPVNWWGARLRLPMVVALLLIPAAGIELPQRFPKFMALGAAWCVAAVAFATFDLGRFHQRETAGLGSVIEAMPAGQRISFIHYSPKSLEEYPGVPLGYFGNFYLLEKGGAVAQDFFGRNEYPLLRKSELPAPPWAMASAFSMASHYSGFNGFLVRARSEGDAAPFTGAAAARVKLVKAVGHWRYYRAMGESEVTR